MTIYNNDNLADGFYVGIIVLYDVSYNSTKFLIVQISYVMGEVPPCENCFDINDLTAFL